jgi:7-keto-8-aminopelargonate synthetase-like enzyme
MKRTNKDHLSSAHVQLEGDLARFMGTEEAIVYSYDIATISSIIPAFANRKDVLIIDEVGHLHVEICSNLGFSCRRLP